MLMAALRLDVPTVFVSGGPMEGGTATLVDGTVRTGLNLVSVIADSASESVSDSDLTPMEEQACPTCGSCSGMFTANSMHYPTQALGLALPGHGTTLPTHPAPRALHETAGPTTAGLARRSYAPDHQPAPP